MKVHFDLAQPDDEAGSRPAPGSPEDQALCYGGLALLNAERVAAATVATEVRWYRLLLATGTDRFDRLNARYQRAVEAHAVAEEALRNAIRDFRNAPRSDAHRLGDLIREVVRVVEAGERRAAGIARDCAGRN